MSTKQIKGDAAAAGTTPNPGASKPPSATGDVFQVYEALWHQAEAEGARVRYDGLTHLDGWFHPDPYGRGEERPTIAIRRRNHERARVPSRFLNAGAPSDAAQPDLRAELVTLAHEYGHFASWKERTARATWQLYYQAARRRDAAWGAVDVDTVAGEGDSEYNERLRSAAREVLTKEQVDLILSEEERAWAFGREALVALGFVDLQSYEEARSRGIRNHRYRLGLDRLEHLEPM